MAIQLSERDMMIFKFIEEHHVLLEKHIAWFISCDEKPVLIRDRLRKLFYLDYLLCQRHGGKLPWWTTPTKPLVYMLSPMARGIVQSADFEIDLANDEIQRHLLEIANLRMIFLMDQKSGVISEFDWQTQAPAGDVETVSAIVSFNRNGTAHRCAVMNQPGTSVEKINAATEKIVSEGKADMIWIISRDEMQQEKLQQSLADSPFASRFAFATHQEIYKSGIVKCNWQSAGRQFAPVIADSVYADPALGQVNWIPSAISA